MNDVLSAMRTFIAAASSTTLNYDDVDSTPCLPPEDGSPEDSKAAFAKYKIPYRGNQISLLEAVEKLRASLKNGKLYCPKTFAMDNEDVINGLLDVGLFSSSTKYSLNEICSYVISGIPDSGHKKSVTFGKLKKLFRCSFRRHQIFPCDQLCFKDLATKISNSAIELEPGEEVERLWNQEISLSFKALVTSQFQYISKATENEESRLTWLKKFIDLLMTKKQLWPVGTMTAAFLKIKASEWLEVIKSNPTAANVLHDFQTPEFTKQELSRVKYYTDLDTPQNTKSPEDDVRFDTFPKKLSPNIAVGSDDTNSCKTTVDQPRTSFPHIHTSRLELHGPRSSTTRISRHRSDDSVVGSESKDHEYEPHCSSSRKGLFRHRSEESYVKGHDHHKNQYSESPNSRSVCSRKTSSRHRSDESLADQKSASVKSPQRKRYSNEYLSEQHRSTKRPKLDDRFFVKKMTDYDQKLQSFQIWDPLRNVTEAKFQDIFKTKEETVINNEQASVGTSSVTLDSNKTLDECEEKGLINIEDIPLPKEDVSTSGIDQKPKISDNNEQQFKCKLGEIVNLCGLTEKKGGHLRLQERYGEMKVKTEELGAERVSVIVTIQGYTFEGIATSRENAVEEASNKALLLAPFILQQTSNLLSEET
ncbi:uncharacterized protein LOC134815955 isoform X2 [Bolinopsis microptera]|uniref:uncharacterized protein LOC134815955 isoform X2 n=1 Tax=Bolinopsis microptera TaxID=2820187 RepID=UPI003079ACB3